ncbi:MAG: non-reducing end alpha-L-arabinofuranosidase family hydrolase, partial [Candidatus Omnitrophota bacterium]
LLAGSSLFVSAVEPAPQPQTIAQATVSADAPMPPFAAPLKWTSSDVLIKPVSDETHSIVSVKDPTVVRYNGLWHIYATVYSTSARTWNMVYLNFKDWSEAANATNNAEAARARAFNIWLKTEWLNDYLEAHPGLKNAAVFDWFDILAYPADDPAHPNRLRQEYGGNAGDSHPNSAANAASAKTFSTFIDISQQEWLAAPVEHWSLY